MKNKQKLDEPLVSEFSSKILFKARYLLEILPGISNKLLKKHHVIAAVLVKV